MPSRKLPAKGTQELEDLKEKYRICPLDKISDFCRKCADLYGFSSSDSFTSSMWKNAGVRREPESKPSPGIEPLPSRITREISMPARKARPNMPLKLKIGENPQVGVVLCDTHNPFQDKIVLSLAEEFLKELQPDFIIYNGDANDFYQISCFDKNPIRIPKMQDDIDDTKAMFKRHREICPNAIIKLLDGNHEERLERFLWSSAPALSSLKCLEIEELFGLKEFGIERIPYECGLMINDTFLIMHGTIASIHSGYTAKRMFEKHGGNGICAHCHRGGSFYKRDRFGTWGWFEGFCLCKLDPDWIMNPNWVQGFNLVHFQGKRFWVEQIPIVGTPLSLMYGGKLYKPEENK